MKRKKYLLAELIHTSSSVTLAEFRAVLSKDEGTVSVLWPRKLQSVQDEALSERVRQVFFCTDYVRNAHLGIIHCARDEANTMTI